jgi:hypothetical protein
MTLLAGLIIVATVPHSTEKRYIARVRQIFVEQGLDAALNSKPSSQLRLRKLDGVAEAGLIACCCSQPPPGRKEWTLRLLADEMVKLEYVNSISHETVRQVLKKTKSSLGDYCGSR